MATDDAKKIGPCGGPGGSANDINEVPQRLQSITICSEAGVINSIEFIYLDRTGYPISAGPWGGSGGSRNVINLLDNEHVTEVSGTVGTFSESTVVSALKIVTNLRTYGPYGDGGGTPFSLPVLQGSAIVGLFARSGVYLDAIGVYVRSIV